jgi:hypothetical protein
MPSRQSQIQTGSIWAFGIATTRGTARVPRVGELSFGFVANAGLLLNPDIQEVTET